MDVTMFLQVKKFLDRARCAACGCWRRKDSLDIYITRKYSDEAHVDYALNYCKDRNYCIRQIIRVPDYGC